MSIKIVKDTDFIEIKNIIVVLYGSSGTGKTSLGFSADRSLLLDFDNGVYRAAFRKDCVQVRTWKEISDLSAQILEPYNTIVIDTVGRLLEVMSAHLLEISKSIKNDPYLNKYQGGGLSLQGYGALGRMFVDFMTKLKSYGKDIILISHSKEVKIKDDTVVRLDIIGNAQDEVRKVADLMGYVFISGNKYTIDFNPNDNYPTKNFPEIPTQIIPNLKENKTFLADLVGLTKFKLNTKTEEMTRANIEFDEVLSLIMNAQTIEEFNQLLNHKLIQSKTGNVILRKKLDEQVKAHGFIFNKDAKQFEELENAEK